MKKAYKVSQNKKTGETFITYDKVVDKNSLRLEKCKEFIKDYDKCIIKLSTDVMISEDESTVQARAWENYFRDNGIKNVLQHFERQSKAKLLSFGKNKMVKEFRVFFILEKALLTEDFFTEILSDCDIMIGVTKSNSYDEILDECYKGYISTFFDNTSFDFVFYDSICVQRMRKMPINYRP